jgi:hypothetical protein
MYDAGDVRDGNTVLLSQELVTEVQTALESLSTTLNTAFVQRINAANNPQVADVVAKTATTKKVVDRKLQEVAEDIASNTISYFLDTVHGEFKAQVMDNIQGMPKRVEARMALYHCLRAEVNAQKAEVARQIQAEKNRQKKEEARQKAEAKRKQVAVAKQKREAEEVERKVEALKRTEELRKQTAAGAREEDQRKKKKVHDAIAAAMQRAAPTQYARTTANGKMEATQGAALTTIIRPPIVSSSS